MKKVIRREIIKKPIYIINGIDKKGKPFSAWLHNCSEKGARSMIKTMKLTKIKIHLAEVTELTYAKIIRQIPIRVNKRTRR